MNGYKVRTLDNKHHVYIQILPVSTFTMHSNLYQSSSNTPSKLHILMYYLPSNPLHSTLFWTFWTLVLVIENKIYIRGEFKKSLNMNFFSPFQPEREFKVCKSCMFPRLFISISNFWKLLNKLYNELGE